MGIPWYWTTVSTSRFVHLPAQLYGRVCNTPCPLAAATPALDRVDAKEHGDPQSRAVIVHWLPALRTDPPFRYRDGPLLVPSHRRSGSRRPSNIDARVFGPIDLPIDRSHPSRSLFSPCTTCDIDLRDVLSRPDPRTRGSDRDDQDTFLSLHFSSRDTLGSGRLTIDSTTRALHARC